jgi:hypothetical protein
MWLCWLLVLLYGGSAFAEVHIRNGRISANIVNEELDMVVKLFQQNTNIAFYIDDDLRERKISADFRNLSIGFGIKKLLEGTGINHAVVGNADGAQAIFIGSSQERQPFYRKVDNSSRLFPERRPPTSYNHRVLQMAPKKKARTPPTRSGVSIPTGGTTLSNEKQNSAISHTLPQGKEN